MRGWFTDIIFRFGVRLLKFPESIRFPFGQNYSQKTKFPARKIIGWCLGGGFLDNSCYEKVVAANLRPGCVCHCAIDKDSISWLAQNNCVSGH